MNGNTAEFYGWPLTGGGGTACPDPIRVPWNARANGVSAGWGADEVEQLDSGSVTLWFASGDESRWNPETLTYTDGDNSVTVTGVTSVSLKFGDDDSDQYATLASAGAFAEFTSERIFEENKGLLA